jgi:hypothetical protein
VIVDSQSAHPTRRNAQAVVVNAAKRRQPSNAMAAAAGVISRQPPSK